MSSITERSYSLPLVLLGLGFIAHYALYKFPYVADILFFLGLLIHSSKLWGADRTLIYVFSAMILGYGAEFIGINTGIVFGDYHYNADNPGMIFDVPYFIPVQYAYLLYGINMLCLAISNKLLLRHHVWMLALLTGVIATLKDLCTDPIKSTVQHIWIWPHGGGYLGVPVHNFVGWFFVFVTLTLVATGLAWHRGNRSATVQLNKEIFYFPLLLLSEIVIFSLSLVFSVPDQFSVLRDVVLLILFLGFVPYVLLGWFNLCHRQ